MRPFQPERHNFFSFRLTVNLKGVLSQLNAMAPFYDDVTYQSHLPRKLNRLTHLGR